MSRLPSVPGSRGLTARSVLRRAAVGAAVAAVVLLAGVGLWAGLDRAGWPVGSPQFSDLHGYLIVLGFLGTLIGIERALAVGSRWAWAWPATTTLGTAVLVLGLPRWVAGILFALCGVVQVAAVVALRRERLGAYSFLMAAAIPAWMAVTYGLVVGWGTSAVVAAMGGYLVLTVAGERLESMGIRPPSGRLPRVLLWIAAIAAAFGAPAVLWWPRNGTVTVAAALCAIAVWLVAFDLPLRTLRLRGLGRQMALALLVGYLWLAAGSAAWAAGWLSGDGGRNDAAVHAVFLGFVMSMVIAHAPVVVPVIARRYVPAWPSLVLPLAILHLSLAVRVAGDLLDAGWAVRWGGVGNGLAFAVVGLQIGLAVAGSRRLSPLPEVYIP